MLAFLDKTVLPCAELLLAAIDRQPGRAENVRRIEERAQGEDATVTYRTVHGTRLLVPGDPHAAANGRNESALTHLYRALDRAPPAQVSELASWARRDPSLEALREGPSADEFRAIVGTGSPGPGHPPPAKKPRWLP